MLRVRIATVILIGASLHLSLAIAATPGTHFCRTSRIRDYLRATLQMPPVQKLGAKGKHPLGFKDVVLTAVGSRIVVTSPLAGASSFAYRLGVKESNPNPIKVNWKVVSALYAVNRHGAPLRSLRVRERNVEHIAAKRSVKFPVGTILQPGFYRFDILIERPNGRRQRFSEYIRAMQPRFDGKLQLNERQFQPESIAYGRVVNAGTDAVDTGYDFRVDRYIEGRWRTVGPNGDPFPAATIRIPPDTAANCFEISLEPTWPAGHYRILKEVSPVFGMLSHKQVSLKADFHIVE